MWKTTDGGLAWTEVASPSPAVTLTSISCRSTSSCEIGGYELGSGTKPAPAFEGTANGGVTWSSQTVSSSAASMVPYAVECTSSSSCISGGTEPSPPTSDVLTNSRWLIAQYSTKLTIFTTIKRILGTHHCLSPTSILGGLGVLKVVVKLTL
jgi:hypothetical protein